MASARFLVSGIVQGVFFRASTQVRAQELGLTGYAKNLADGRVEVAACGTQDDLQRLQTWLQQGPPAARVEQVTREDWPEPAGKDFSCR